MSRSRKSWPNVDDPAVNDCPNPSEQATPRKLRRFMGLLMNAEDALRARGFDVAEAYRFALREHDRLLEPSSAPVSPETTSPGDVETELFHRMARILEILRPIRPASPTYLEFLDYHTRWARQREAAPGSASPVTPAPSPTREETAPAPILAVAWDQLLAWRARLAAAELPHEFVAPYLVFLAGLQHALRAADRPAGSEVRGDDGLREAAAPSLRDAVEFALQEKAQALVASSSGLSGDTEFQCLFMGVAFAQKNHTEAVDAWLRRGNYQANLLRLLFAMGTLAATDRAARRLHLKFSARLPGLVEASFGKDAREALAGFPATAD